MGIVNANQAKWAMTFCLTVLMLNNAYAIQEIDTQKINTKIAQMPKTSSAKVSVKIRNSGYTMGDLMHMQAVITLADKQKLDPDSLPLVGRMNPWLDLREIKMREQQVGGKNQVVLDFTWQLFATVATVDTLKTPAIVVNVLADEMASQHIQNKETSDKVATYANTKADEADKQAGKKAAGITIPATQFYVSPTFATEIPSEIKRHPNLPPLRFDTRTPLINAGLLIIFAAFCGALFLWLKDLIVWLPRRPGFITQLARQYRKQPPIVLQAIHLKEIHVALNASAGHTLYPNNLHTLFEGCPYLQHEKAAIAQFLHTSWAQFYGNECFAKASLLSVQSHDVIDTAQTLQWIQRASTAERLFRRQAKAVTKPLKKPLKKNVTHSSQRVQSS